MYNFRIVKVVKGMNGRISFVKNEGNGLVVEKVSSVGSVEWIVINLWVGKVNIK